MLNKFIFFIIFFLIELDNVFAATASNTFNVGISVPTFCQVTTTNLNFAAYNSSQDKNATSNVNVTCSVSTPYTVKLSTGNSGTYTTRNMKSGNNILNYNIYTTSEHNSIWGDGNSGTSTVSGTGNGQTITHTVYGKIPQDQNVNPGVYTDTINVTVTY